MATLTFEGHLQVTPKAKTMGVDRRVGRPTSGIRSPTSGYDPVYPVRYADATSVERLASYIALSALRMSPSGWSSKLE